MRFSLTTALLALTAACVWLTSYKLFGGFWAFILLNSPAFIALIGAAMWRPPWAIGWLLAFQTLLIVCLGVLVASYHINGRAWHDYGGSWNPPPYLDEHGAVEAVNVDYDPKNTRPYMWPWIGDAMAILIFSAIGLMIFPPTAPLCTLVLFKLLRTHSTYPKAIRVTAWIEIAVASALMTYLVCWELNILEWIVD
jgi:hypothetical protein